MAKLTYTEQLQHPNWQRKRLEVFKNADFKCQICGDRESMLHVHHKSYIKGRMAWDYPDANFEALCAACHKEHHVLREALDRVLTTPGAEGVAYSFLTGYLVTHNESLAAELEGAMNVTPRHLIAGLALHAMGLNELENHVLRLLASGDIDASFSFLKGMIDTDRKLRGSNGSDSNN